MLKQFFTMNDDFKDVLKIILPIIAVIIIGCNLIALVDKTYQDIAKTTFAVVLGFGSIQWIIVCCQPKQIEQPQRPKLKVIRGGK